MKNPYRKYVLIVPAAIALATVLYATSAFAHAVVFPKRAEPGAYEKYVLRVPNERDQPTTRVEIRFPADVKVVSFSDVAGWKLEVETDSAKRIVGAIWTGKLAPQRFVEFPFVAVNPKTAAQLVWPAFQTYGDGERVEWTGPAGSDKPASVTVIASGGSAEPSSASGAGAANPADPAVNAADAIPADTGRSLALPLSMIALAIAFLALGLALRNKRADG